ncbi:MAG TPA: methyltransferase domain-containing protein [Ramlibacter sp.]
MDSPLEQARALFLAGLAHYEAGRLPQAGEQFAAALALAPGRPSLLTNRGAVRLKLGQREEALGLLQQALVQEPDNVEALGHSAAALAELGESMQALARFDRALALDPTRASLWTLRGSVLKELGRDTEAAASFQAALERGGDRELNRYYLAGVSRMEPPPPNAPRHYVEDLFDGYAEQFDTHLVQALRYDAPRRLAERLAGRACRAALDLGCGTGLCGPFLRPLAASVTGVDLSRNMLDKAQALGTYDTLLQADVAEYLAAAREPFDLVIAADVFVYVGRLEGVFRDVARLLPPGGTFCFTVEEALAGEDVALRTSLRYAHSEAYLRRLAQENGLRLVALERAPVREEQRQPIPGLFVWLERS